MNENNEKIKNDRFKNLKTKGIAALLSATTFLGGLGIGIGATQAKANAKLREYENANKNDTYSVELAQKETEIADLQKSLASVNGQVAILQDYVNQLKQINADAAKTVQEHLDTIKSLGNVVNSTNDASATWAKYAQEYKAQVEALTETLKEQYKNADELKAAIEDLKNQVSHHKNNEASLQGKIDALQETIKTLTDELAAQGQKPVDPTAPTIEGFKTSFSKVIEENKNDKSPAIDSQIKRLISEVELAYYQGILPYDEVLSLLQDVKLALDPHFNEMNDNHYYLAEAIDDVQFIIFADHLNRTADELVKGNNGLAVEMTLNNDKVGQYYAGQYNGEKSLFMSEMDETYFLHKDKSNFVQGSYNGDYLSSNLSQNQNSSETENMIDNVINSLLDIDILSFTGEGSEFMYGDDNRDFTILEDGSYQIDGHTIDGYGENAYTLEYLAKFTENTHGGFDCEVKANDGVDTAERNAFWGKISEKEYEEIKTEILKNIENAKANDSNYEK